MRSERHPSESAALPALPPPASPNRQIRSQPSPVPAQPPAPFASPLVLVNGHLAGPSRTSVPACHLPHGRNVVAVPGRCRQTRSLATPRLPCDPWLQSTRFPIWCSTPGRDENHQPTSLKGKPSRPCATFLVGPRPPVVRAVGYGPTTKPASSLGAGRPAPPPAADIRGLPIAVSPGTTTGKSVDQRVSTMIRQAGRRRWARGYSPARP
jgi:hypothetical protein